MVVVAGTAKLKPEASEQARNLVDEVVRLTRPEPGCHSYTFYISLEDSNTIHVFEEWESDEALNSHLQQEHTQHFLESLAGLVSEPPDVKRYYVDRVTPL